MNKNKKINVFTDCDGVWTDRLRLIVSGEYEKEDYVDLLNLFIELDKRHGYEFAALTDRGIAQLPGLSFVMQMSRFQAGESGAGVYDIKKHGIIKNPQFLSHIRAVSNIVIEFEDIFGDLYTLEPGVLSSIRVERTHNEEDMSHATAFLSKKAIESFGQFVCVDHGDCISFKPSTINKDIGIRYLLHKYKEAGIEIDLTNTLWIADGKSDILAGEYIVKNGGKVSAVANSHVDYLEFVKSHNGYVAQKSFSAGMAEIIRHHCI